MKHISITALIALIGLFTLTAFAREEDPPATPPGSSSLIYFQTSQVKNAGELITTNKPVRVDFLRPPYETVSVLFGPNPGGSGDAVGSLQMATMPDGTGNEWPYFQVQNGFALVWGSWPMARTTTVSAGSFGTTYIVQNQGAKHRVILLKTSKDITAWRTSNATLSQTWSGKNMYVELDESVGQMQVPKSISNSTEVTALVNHVKAKGAEFGADLGP